MCIRDSYKVHQEALLIYNKQTENKNELSVDRSVSVAKLTSIEPKSLEYRSFLNDRKDQKLMPMLNPLNYAPYDGGSYREKDLVSLNELRSCFTKNCDPLSGMHTFLEGKIP